MYIINVQFEWDDNKACANALKHRISFKEAATAFDDPEAMIADDPKHSKGRKTPMAYRRDSLGTPTCDRFYKTVGPFNSPH